MFYMHTVFVLTLIHYIYNNLPQKKNNNKNRITNTNDFANKSRDNGFSKCKKSTLNSLIGSSAFEYFELTLFYFVTFFSFSAQFYAQRRSHNELESLTFVAISLHK